MDNIDREILEVLKEDGRASYTRIGEKVGVSEGTVRNRVKDMKEREVIEKFTVETTEGGSKAVVMVKVSTDVDISGVIDTLPDNMEVNEVTGDYDIISVFDRESSEKLNRDIDIIRKVEGVEDTRTYTVLNTEKK